MIFDNMKNCEKYYGVHPKFEKAFEFIKKAIDENMEVGKYEIEGENLRASIQCYDTKLAENSMFEGHEDFIDIQCIISGCETMGCMDISKAVVSKPYNAEKDVAGYEVNDKASYCVAQDGEYCVFFPYDIHRPGMAYENVPAPVKKIVVKVHI